MYTQTQFYILYNFRSLFMEKKSIAFIRSGDKLNMNLFIARLKTLSSWTNQLQKEIAN